MGDLLSDEAADLVAAMPEFRMGVKRVGLRLRSGRRVDDVLVSGRRVVRVLGQDVEPFDAEEIREVENQADRPMP